MFLTKECDYAIRAVRSLANCEVKSVINICENEHIPRSFAYKILKKLEHGGLVTSFRGVDGGYKLAKDPAEITLFEIVSSIDSQLFINECLEQGFICPMNSGEKECGVHRELCRIQALLKNALTEKMVADLIS